MKLKCVTITGADESVDPAWLLGLSERYPYVEWGILLSQKRSGKEPRYPGAAWIKELSDAVFKHKGVNLSLHLCGQWGREALVGEWRPPQQLFYICMQAQRIQFNVPNPPLTKLVETSKQHILPVPDFAAVPANFAPLFDRSGGRGALPSEWPTPLPGVYCGYAGGLTPANLDASLQAILGLADDTQECWVDMESGVRGHRNGQDVFDLDKVEACLRIAERYVA